MSALDIVAASSQAWQDADKFIRLRVAEAAIARVRDLHQREPLLDFEWCNRCDSQWPCDTIRALDGEQ